MKKVVPLKSILIPENAETVFTGKIFSVHQWPQVMFDGSTETFEMLRRPDTVVVIGIVGNTLLVLDEEQPNNPGRRHSFPAGRVDPTDMSTLHGAQREVLEETGYAFDNWKLVHVGQPQGKLEWFIYVYVAWGAEKVADQKLDAGEKIDVQLLSYDEAKAQSIHNEGFMGDAKEIFEATNSLEDLTLLPEFQGVEIER